MIGPYCPVCLAHTEDDQVGESPTAPMTALSAAAHAAQRSYAWLLVLLVLLTVAGAAVALIWDTPNLWLLLVPVAMVTLILSLREHPPA